MFETGSNLSTASVVAAAVDGAGAVKSTTNTLHPPPPQNSFMCDVCKVTTNSPQQLHMHFIGKSHKKIVTAQQKSGGIASTPTEPHQIPPPAPSLRCLIDLPPPMPPIDLPDNVIFIQDPNSMADGNYKCKSCDCLLNSHGQLQEHLRSARHQSWEAGIPYHPPKTREERKFSGNGPAKFAQKRSNTADADSWKSARTFDREKGQHLRNFFTKGPMM